MEKVNSPTSALRNANRASILGHLVQNDVLQRNDLCEMTGLTGAAVSRIVRELINCRLVVEREAKQPKGHLGRHSVSLALNAKGAFIVAVTITANRRSVALYDARRNLVELINLEGVDFKDPKTALILIVDAINRLRENHADAFERLAGIGVGIAAPSTGFITEEGVVGSEVMGWQDVPVGQILRAETGLAVKIETRSSALLRAELSVSMPQQDKNIFLTNVGIGIGSASRLGGAFQFMENSGLGRLSHITHPNSDARCFCGRRGCLEHAASGVAVVRDVFGVGVGPQIPFSDLGPKLTEASNRAKQGDETAIKAFFEAGRKMALGIDIACAMLNPDLILLAGETGRQPDYVRGVRSGLRELLSPLEENQLQISNASSAEASACVALDAFVYSGSLMNDLRLGRVA